MTDTVTGEVKQLLEPGDEQHYTVPEHLARELESGRSLAVVRTTEPPGWVQALERLPMLLAVAVEIVLFPLELLPFDVLPDSSQWDTRVVVENPDFTEGETVTLETIEQVADTTVINVAREADA